MEIKNVQVLSNGDGTVTLTIEADGLPPIRQINFITDGCDAELLAKEHGNNLLIRVINENLAIDKIGLCTKTQKAIISDFRLRTNIQNPNLLDYRDRTFNERMRIRGLGKKGYEEMDAKLREYGFE